MQGVSKAVREGSSARPLLHSVDLHIAHGEIVALLGASGTGKSTLLNLAAGLEPPDEGTVCLDGVPLDRIHETARTRLRRRAIGFVFQFFNLVPTLSVLENARLPLELNGLDDAATTTRLHALLDAVGLGARLHAWPAQLSGGEQQRVALVRALVHRPALLLADEPTGSLDAESGQRVLQLLIELAREHQSAVLIVTHDASVAAVADRRLKLVAGRLEICPA
ncbi:putative ABC transport system ATP-binding protein [Plasticicumulans acidivorans]|uniref:Putative ABC transport system ATP-binding protein n=2 Tax=Plasticicumulans acidivorans TaxID=886464 RepID=A0A317MZK5_9GAMM|nr:putative ABC transport system ATP-binding protein [Plasticicumulans acidivorans]